jgi:hypothetical protein
MDESIAQGGSDAKGARSPGWRDAGTNDKFLDMYDDFDGFLKAAIKEFYERHGKRNPARFVALLVASGETLSLAWDSLKSGNLPKRLAIGTVGLIALRVGLKYALAGPLGVIATGITLAGMARYLYKNQGDVAERTRKYKRLIEDSRAAYDGVAGDFASGRFSRQERDMMLDGLLARLLADLAAD